jgi:hypothetical protein
VRPEARPGPCSARAGLPRCIGGTCSHCASCGNYSFRTQDASCLYCFPPSTDAPAAKPKKRPAPKVRPDGRLHSIKPTGKSRAPEAIRREHLYAKQMGMTLGSNDDDINHA